jgi:hypothetical protein
VTLLDVVETPASIAQSNYGTAVDQIGEYGGSLSRSLAAYRTNAADTAYELGVSVFDTLDAYDALAGPHPGCRLDLSERSSLSHAKRRYDHARCLYEAGWHSLALASAHEAAGMLSLALLGLESDQEGEPKGLHVYETVTLQRDATNLAAECLRQLRNTRRT